MHYFDKSFSEQMNRRIETILTREAIPAGTFGEADEHDTIEIANYHVYN